MRVLLDYEMAAALAAVQAGVSLLFAYVFLRLEGPAPHLFASARGRRTTPLGGRWQDAWLWVLLAVLTVFFVGPMASIVADSVRGADGGVSLQAYERIVTAGHDFHLGGPPLRSIQNSLRFAATAALIALAAGASFVYATVRFIGRRLPLLETLSLAPMAVSSVALAYGISVAFRGPLQFVPQDLRIPLVHAVLAFPFVVRAFRPVLQGRGRPAHRGGPHAGGRPLAGVCGRGAAHGDDGAVGGVCALIRLERQRNDGHAHARAAGSGDDARQRVPVFGGEGFSERVGHGGFVDGGDRRRVFAGGTVFRVAAAPPGRKSA